MTCVLVWMDGELLCLTVESPASSQPSRGCEDDHNQSQFRNYEVKVQLFLNAKLLQLQKDNCGKMIEEYPVFVLQVSVQETQQ